MAKEPRAGLVKTRLARDIGVVAALRFYRATMTSLIARLSADRRWHTTIAIAPRSAVASAMFGPVRNRVPQGAGGLGIRLQRLADEAAPGPIVIIGTDIPGIAPADIEAAFRALGSHDAVIGPASDGGYWLVGLKRRPRTPRPFANVRWSSVFARGDTLANLAALGVTHVRNLDDVDTGADYKRLAADCGRRILPAGINKL